jgi:pimeloyl-ACP methyl ester carboxylesterase
MAEGRYRSDTGTPDPSAVLVAGPWRHRDVTAGGQRFHVAECGDPVRPTVLLLHGFPQFWWSWRHQLVALGDAGWHAVAVDLKGYGASDKPPRGYDGFTLSADLASLVRALGKTPAVLIGHDWGGTLAWDVAATSPELVSRLVVISAGHRLAIRHAMLTSRRQARLSAYMLRFQMPRADDWLLDDDADEVARLLREWGGPGFPDDESDQRYRHAIRIPGAGHSALEYYRWAVRSQLRPSGHTFMRRVDHPVRIPVLHIHGALDGCVLPDTALASARWAGAGFTWRLYDAVGHFPPEEAPHRLTEDLTSWLGPPR